MIMFFGMFCSVMLKVSIEVCLGVMLLYVMLMVNFLGRLCSLIVSMNS